MSMLRHTLRAVLALLLCLLALLPVQLRAEAANLFLLHSYSQEYPWTRNQHDAFVDTLRELSPVEMLFSTEYLDTKRKPFDATYRDDFSHYLARKYQGYHPDLIYVTDDNALLFARDNLSSLFPGVPVVFSGVNDYSVLETLDRGRITGVFEKKEIAPNLEIIASTRGREKRVAFVGDGSNTDLAIRHEIERELQAFPELTPDFISGQNLDALISQLKQANYHEVILTTIGGVKDQGGNNMSLSEIVGRIGESGDFVLISMEDAYLYPGVLGGYMTSGSRQGQEAASMAANMLRGKAIREIAPLLQSPNAYIFEAAELSRHNIELPVAVRRQAQIRNPEPTFYQQNRSLIMGSFNVMVIVLLLTMVVSVLLMRHKNREVNDVAEALHAEHEKLRQTQQSLIEAQRIASMGSWTLELQSNQLEWSDEIFQIFEIDKSRFTASYDAFLQAIHPDDRERVNQAYLNSVENKTEYEIQHRLQMPDGRIKYVLERGSTSYDCNGQPLRSVGTVQDISERVLAEQRLRQWAEVFENTIEGVMITDEQARITDVNRAFCEITGFTRDEVLGQRPNMRRSERHDEAFYQQMWQSINEKGSWSGEIWNRKKSGELVPEWLSITSLRDDNGSICNYIGVFTDISVLKRSEEKLEHLATHDPLTGLPNRTLLQDRLESATRRAQRTGSKVTVLFLDLDRFKIVNDTMGHAVGDRVLKEAAARMSQVLRDADTMGRLGGDEFLAIMEGEGKVSDIEVVSERLRDSIAQPFIVDGNELFIGVSIGISIFPDDGGDAATLIRNADSAMYQAKKRGRNSIAYYDALLTEQALQHMDMDVALRRAIERDEFMLYFQPKVALSTGKITSAEVLLRWLRDGEQMIGPDQFIPVAEESGLILPIGEWVLRESSRQMRVWLQAGLELHHLAVNLSAIQIQRGNIPSLVRELLSQYQLKASDLELEITESVLFDYPEQAGKVLSELREIGVTLAMDDFGTGFSSLMNLKQYPIDTIKIDRSFINDLLTNPNDEAITRAILAMGKSLDLTVVAEGVEQADQAAYLHANGSDLVQGYFYSPPLSAEEFEQLMRSQAL